VKIAYFDCYSGISGDMTLGAFIDAGLNINTLRRELAKLKLKGYSLTSRHVMRGSLSGIKLDVVETGRGGTIHHHRTLGGIVDLIERSALNKVVKELAVKIFENLGRAEAKVHGVKFGRNISFHELGEIDSIIDIVGCAVAVNELGIDSFYASRVTNGYGMVTSQHGPIPIPAPAALELLKGVPVEITGIRAELVTPTGAAILKTLVTSFGPMPFMTILSTGYGAGTKIIDERPNMLRVIIGEMARPFSSDHVRIIETNIDDMSPQIYEYLFELLLAEGALDVFITPVIMKKSRPAQKLTVVCPEKIFEKIAGIIFNETSSIGIRYYDAARCKLERAILPIRTIYGIINVKVSSGPDGIKTSMPEYEDCRKAALKYKVPFKAVHDAAKNNLINKDASRCKR